MVVTWLDYASEVSFLTVRGLWCQLSGLQPCTGMQPPWSAVASKGLYLISLESLWPAMVSCTAASLHRLLAGCPFVFDDALGS
jgi:hypothetical protein